MKKIKQNIEIPNEIIKIHQIFKNEGFDLFLVGGCVRDSILNIKPKDWDLVTNALPDKIIELLKKENFVTNILETGKAFGVINVITKNDEFEIATMRQDIGSGRRPDSVIFTNIETDILRRDLTCNALFFDIEAGEIVDLVGGLDDLKNNVVRTVGAAKDRFAEDRLRILRAIRFAARFGSDLHIDIASALIEDSNLDGISHERIKDEFLKGLKSAKSITKFLFLVDVFDLFDWVFPDLNINKQFRIKDDPIVVIASLLQFNDRTFLAKQLNKLTFSTDEVKAIMFLISLTDLELETAVEIKRKQKNSGVTTDQILNFTTRECIPSQLVDSFLAFELSVTGEDVMRERGLKPGPELGKAILEIETANFKKIIV